MPLAYGGGISSVEQATRLFRLGVEKVCLQTAALENPDLISELAARFGSQSIVVSVDVRSTLLGGRHCYHAARRSNVSGNWREVIGRLVGAGAGELLLNAVDRDGTMSGPDLALIREASALVDVPVIALGGVGSLADVRAAVDAGASAVAAGAFFVFHGPHRAVLITYPEYREIESLFQK
jgi:cyclase